MDVSSFNEKLQLFDDKLFLCKIDLELNEVFAIISSA